VNKLRLLFGEYGTEWLMNRSLKTITKLSKRYTMMKFEVAGLYSKTMLMNQN
jgi:hypothetical protein